MPPPPPLLFLSAAGESTISEPVSCKGFYLFTPLLRNRLSVSPVPPPASLRGAAASLADLGTGAALKAGSGPRGRTSDQDQHLSIPGFGDSKTFSLVLKSRPLCSWAAIFVDPFPDTQTK